MMRPSPHAGPAAVLLGMLLAWAAAGTAPLDAQAARTDSATATGIEGYAAIPWGADSSAVAAHMGPPDTVREVESMDARALIYGDHRLGRTRGSLGFLVALSEGLLRVVYLTPYGSGERCLELYQTVRNSVSALFPSLSRRERMYNNLEDLDFCTAFQLGRAGARSIWRDPDRGARAWVALDLTTGAVRASFESPAFRRRADEDPPYRND